jgi:repressor LexA
MITERQHKILAFITAFREEHGLAPSFEDIRKGLGFSSKDLVSRELEALSKAGYVTRTRNVARSLCVTARYGAPGHVSRIVSIPLLGRIVAGEPIRLPDTYDAPFGPGEHVDVAEGMIGKAEGVYALQVQGHSMIDALVDDGDIVILKAQCMAENGAMVAVWLRNEETTLKRFYHEGDHIRLQPANRTMPPLYFRPADVEIQGIVLSVIRRSF